MFDYNYTFETSNDAILASTDTVQTSMNGRPLLLYWTHYIPSWLGYKPCCCL